MTKMTGYSRAAVLAAMAMGAQTAAAQDAVTLEYWVYSDFAQGEALKLQQGFIDEFEASHPGVSINIAGKGDDDLLTGQLAGAASGTGPDVFMNSTSAGAALAEVGALKNIYDDWMSMPEEYREQFDQSLIEMCTPAPETMYCLPYTGYGSFMYRNLAVLEEAGIDPSKRIEGWSDWLSQMEQIKASGKTAIPDMTQNWASVLNIYSGVADNTEWGADFETNETLVNSDKYAETAQFFLDTADLNSGTNVNDQATTDLFISNQLAFIVNGPWVNPRFEQAAAETGLKFDRVLVPGKEPGTFGGVQGYEFIGVAPKEHADVAWEFAAFVTEKTQMIPWAAALGRYNANIASLQDPSVAEHPLLKVTYEAAKHALYNKPPFFQGTFPNAYWSAITDNAGMVADGDIAPSEAGEELVKELNDILADR